MNRTTLQVGTFEVNCSILSENDKAIVVDPGAEATRIRAELKKQKLDLAAVLLTHAHFDHIGAIPELQQVYPDLPVFISDADAKIVSHPFNQFPPDYPLVAELKNVKNAKDLGSFLAGIGWTATVEATATGGEVVVEARFNEDAIQSRFVLPIVQMRQIPIEAYVVCDAQGKGATTQAAIEEKIQFANIVWAQAGIAFYLSGDAVELHCPQYYDIAQFAMRTNAQGVVQKWPSAAVYGLMNQVVSNECFKTFWVHSITNGTPLAFSIFDYQTLFMSSGASSRAFAHELGHLLALDDIYDSRKVGGRWLVMNDIDAPVKGTRFTSIPHDWGAESQRGFYAESDANRLILRSFLMYGFEPSGGSSAVDLPNGTVNGYRSTSQSDGDIFPVPIGAGNITTQ